MLKCFHLSLFCVYLIRAQLAICFTSSTHLICSFPLYLNTRYGLHCSIGFDLLTIYPTKLHFNSTIASSTSLCFVIPWSSNIFYSRFNIHESFGVSQLFELFGAFRWVVLLLLIFEHHMYIQGVHINQIGRTLSAWVYFCYLTSFPIFPMVTKLVFFF